MNATKRSYRLFLVDRDPFTGKPAHLAILRATEPNGRRWTVATPIFRSEVARRVWVDWASVHYSAKPETSR